MCTDKTEIINLAHKMRDKFFSDKCSVKKSLCKIFNEYNIEIKYEDVGEPHRKMKDKYIFTLSMSTSILTDNYTVACYIGYIVLGYDIEKHENREHHNNTCVFASELLMPEKQFRIACEKYKNNEHRVARVFSVTSSTARVRMMVLKIKKII